MDAQPPTNFS